MNSRTCVLAVVLIAPLPAGAQDVPAQMSIADAIAIARQHSPAQLRVANDADVAAAAVRQSYAGLAPSLTGGLGFSGSRARRLTAEDEFGEVVGGEEYRTVRGSTASQNVGLNMTLFDGGAMFRRVGAAQAAEVATAAQIAASAHTLDAEVAQLYRQAQRAQRMIVLEGQLLTSARERLERSEELFRLAAASQVDVLGARVDVASQEQALARADDDARKAMLTLLQAIGIAPRLDGAPALSEPEPVAFDPARLDADALVAYAIERNPVILQRVAATRAADRRAGVARAGRWPTITASLGYGRSGSFAGYDAFGNFDPPNSGLTFDIGASLPIFTRLQTSLDIAQTAATLDDARQDERAARLQVERDVRAALIDLENAYRQLALAQEKAELSAERLQLATEQYRLGALTFLNLQRVIDETSTAERQAVDALYGFASARVALEEKLGAPLPE